MQVASEQNFCLINWCKTRQGAGSCCCQQLVSLISYYPHFMSEQCLSGHGATQELPTLCTRYSTLAMWEASGVCCLFALHLGTAHTYCTAPYRSEPLPISFSDLEAS